MMQSKGGSVIIGLFVVIAATLLFIPELARFSRGAGGQSDTQQHASAAHNGNKKQAAAGGKSVEEDIDEVPQEESREIPEDESFNRLMDSLEDEDVEIDAPEPAEVNPVPPQVAETESAPATAKAAIAAEMLEEAEKEIAEAELQEPGQNLSLGSVSEPPIPAERRKARAEMKRLLSAKNVNWNVLKNRKVKQPILSAIKEASTLLKVVGRKFPRSRFALLSYVNALKSLMKGRGHAPTNDFREMLEYIGVLDVRVTQSFIEERIDRTEYLIWRAISLGPIVDIAGAQNDFEYEAPFRANITLTHLDLKVAVNRREYKRLFNVSVIGVLESREARRIEVYQGKRLVKIIQLPRRKFREGHIPLQRFQFSYKDHVGSKPYTFRAVDDRGNYIQKSYSLIALPMRKFKNRDGVYEIPGVKAPKLNERPLTRLDETLLISARGNVRGKKQRRSFGGSGGDEVMEFSTFDTRIERLKQF